MESADNQSSFPHVKTQPSPAGRKSPQPDEPIAIVGMACRFPQAPNLDEFWNLLEAGRSAVTQGTPGSGVGRVGQLYPDANVQNGACLFGAFLDEVDRFDAEFFRISPVEAQSLDPQQRLMLETSWRALEDAGIDPARLIGSRTGVFAGISNMDYRELVLGSSVTAEPASSLYSVSGTSINTAIGRVCFALGFQGPAIALDTACSSSLVAIHQAVIGLRRGEADLMLAGGVHATLSGRLYELRGNAGMLAPDGQCKTFDAAADGYVRGEGCGIIVLRRLSEAEASGDRIWGVIRGSATNQDGASQGLTVPNGAAQEIVIADALRRAGVSPAQVDYVETHGTGTPVGDPIEAQATGAAYGIDRDPKQPLLIGSVKTNLGHLESAAGVAAVMKVILAINRRFIPKHRNFETPNPEIDWDRLPLRVTSEATQWPRSDGRAPLAGVSGFGWSGTNAHIILEGYNRPEAASDASAGSRWPTGAPYSIAATRPEDVSALPAVHEHTARKTRLLPLSGKNSQALQEAAGRYLAWLDKHAADPAIGDSADSPLLSDMAWTASTGRSHFAHRSALTFGDSESLRQQLKSLSESPSEPETAAPRKVAFAYTGQASQWPGMGQDLYATEPVFRVVLDQCEVIFKEERGASLLDVMFGRATATGDLVDTAWAQPAIYALECALTALWASVDVRPDVVVGHSLGEYAATQAAGVFSLEAGMRFITRRSALLAALPGEGAMAAIFAPEPQVNEAMRAVGTAFGADKLSIAAYNGAHQVVSGTVPAVEAVMEHFESRDIRVRRLNTRQAFHSAWVEPALEGLEAALDDIAISPPAIDLVSNVTGRIVARDELLDVSHWRRHTREPVAFSQGIQTLAESGVDVVVEVGPHAVLGPMSTLAWPEQQNGQAVAPPIVIASLRRPPKESMTNEPESSFVEAVGAAYEAGLEVSFAGLFAGESRCRISLPDYPFQRRRHWVDAPRRGRSSADHALLGSRHESPHGEVLFATELSASDPAWLDDHLVYGRHVVPGALFGAMALSAAWPDGRESAVVEDFQLLSPLILPEDESEDGSNVPSRSVQLVLGASDSGSERNVEVYSKGLDEDGWTLHVEGRISLEKSQAGQSIGLNELRRGLAATDMSAFYRARADVNVTLGARFRTLQDLHTGVSEAVGVVALPDSVDRSGVEAHPILLDGCFQVMAAARQQFDTQEDVAYLPFGWEKLWLTNRLPDTFVCHARMRDSESGGKTSEGEDGAPEVLTGDLRLFSLDGAEIGGIEGYTVKRATRAALLSASEDVEDLLYEVIWRDCALPEGMPAADFLVNPSAVAAKSASFAQFLAEEGVAADDRAELLTDLNRLAWSYARVALERLGWKRVVGETVVPEALRQQLNVLDEHERLFRRMLEMQVKAGILEEADADFAVIAGQDDPLPKDALSDPDAFAHEIEMRYAHGENEIGVFGRSARALADVLRGEADPLTLLFSSGAPTAADLYRKAPMARATNKMLGDAVARLLSEVPNDRSLRILEVGAGTGSATAMALPELPEGRYTYVYTDISAGFFAEAEARFGGAEASIEYKVLDIEKDPVAQGFNAHGYDLVIAGNVLHATRYLLETLGHCRELLAPSGLLVALETLGGQNWLDLTFGQLDGWWRFADDFRPDHALVGPEIWIPSLRESGFEEIEVLGSGNDNSSRKPERGVILARGPSKVLDEAGTWVLAADRTGRGAELAAQLAQRNQTVVLVDDETHSEAEAPDKDAPFIRESIAMNSRESWSALLAGLPEDLPLKGVVNLTALDGHGIEATTEDFAADVKRVGSSALALLQGMFDADVIPSNGTWFLTHGGQVLEREQGGELSGATLWGLGKVVSQEAAEFGPRMLDLDPGQEFPIADLVNELLFPDLETHVAYRGGLRRAARLVRNSATEPLVLPEDSHWMLEPDPGGSLERVGAAPLPARPLASREVRVAVDAAGLNFWDVFRSLALIEEGLLGREFCGRVLEVAPDVTSVAVGDRVVGLAFGTFGPEATMREELVALAPAEYSATELATIPTTFVTAALSFDIAQLKAGERVLIHAGAGGVGMSAIQLAHALGAEVYATASAPKQAILRSLGVKHVFDSRRTDFGKQILAATAGEGVQLVLNSLTGDGFIESSLSCLAHGGRFVELAQVGIFSEEEMAAARPDVAYDILDLDALKEHDPVRPGDALRRIMALLEQGVLQPLTHTRWSLAEAGKAMDFMRAGRHIGKIVLANSPIKTGQLRDDRTYLVTGGLGGIGCALAGWLADRGAGAIALNGRRDPDPEAVAAIAALRNRGVSIRVELADVTEPAAVDAMLARIEDDLPPLGGIIHSVGVLSDAALSNQTWESFEEVLWPKVLGAWHLHRATLDRDLDLFVLFSSITGVVGNAGQANHGAANAFLDQLAAHRRALGVAGQSIAWGAWSGLGEAEEQRERIAQQLEAAGTGWMTPQQGTKALERLMRQDVTSSLAAAVDWDVFSQNHEHTPPLLEDLLSESETGEEELADATQELMPRLGGATATERETILATFLQQELQAVMRLSTQPALSVEFSELGMDSLMAVELRNRINRGFAGEYTASNTVVFDYPSITGLARHLAGELGGAEEAAGAGAPEILAEQPVQRQAPRDSTDQDGIAIVGMACRIPGAEDLDGYWRLMEAGRNMVTDGRQDSGSWAGVAGDPAADDDANRRGAFVDDIDQFDSRFFKIAPIEARMMDPQQRMLLETSWHALEDAGIDPDTLRGSRTGVYAGIGGSEYRRIIAEIGERDDYLGTTGGVAVGRVSFALGLEGPAVPFELACAASMVAVHQAAASLQRGEIDLALAGGANAVLSQSIMGFLADAGMLSLSGQCWTFDAAADGYVRGEGCAMVILKRLSDAEADGDRIWGVIRGSAVNQNGAGLALTVPNGPAQQRAMEDALAQAGVTPADVDYMEAHGPGTVVGDSVELNAVSEVYGKGRAPDSPLLIGSVKTNIGHLEAAGGIASLIKTILAMHREIIPRHLNFSTPNPEINWERLPVHVTSEATPWPSTEKRSPIASINVFGISGSNAHVVVEGYHSPDAEVVEDEPYRWPSGALRRVEISPSNGVAGDSQMEDASVPSARLLPLSGKTHQALRQLAERYLTWLDDTLTDFAAPDVSDGSILADMAWTAGVGRSHFAHRAGLAFENAKGLRAELSRLVASEENSDTSEPSAGDRVAFVYSGDSGRWTGLDKALYEQEPVARAILDRCDGVLREEQDTSLLDVMFGQAGTTAVLSDPTFTQPAIYALGCSFTALWASVGVRPSVVIGGDVGEIVAAQAAGAIGLEDGLRLAVALGASMAASVSEKSEKPTASALAGILADDAFAPLSLPLLSVATGHVTETGDTLDLTGWQRQTEPSALKRCANAMSELGVDAIVEIGPRTALGNTLQGLWPTPKAAETSAPIPVVIKSTIDTPEKGSPTTTDSGFHKAVAAAYEAGLTIDFAGLFAGEWRRRISLPSYPFQRRRHWI